MPIAYFNQLATLIGGHFLKEVIPSPITELTVDSRSKPITEFPLFFALIGPNHDGHDYLLAAYEGGIRQFVVDTHYHPSFLPKDVNLLQVRNSLTALQQLASFHRAKFQLSLLSITGSYGKTTIKEWMHLFLSSKYHTISSPHSYNSQVGVPLSVSLLEPTHTYGIFEAGISTLGEMDNLAPIIQPTHGLFTNIGPAHSQGFESELQKITEKVALFKTCHKIYYCRDHPFIHKVLQQHYATQKMLIHWSWEAVSSTYLVTKENVGDTTIIQIKNKHTAYQFTLPFRDCATLENLIHCLVYLLDQDFDPCQLQQLLFQLPPLPMRLTLKAGLHRCWLIEDTYTHDLSNLKLALDRMQQQNKAKPQTLILSDLVQVAPSTYACYEAVATLLQKYPIHRLIGIGPTISKHAALFTLREKLFFNQVEDFISHPPTFIDELILLKGRDPRIVQWLEKNTQDTTMATDLHAIRHNLCYFRSKLKPATKIMAMVKAASYGSRGHEVALALQRHGVDYLSVAHVDEGIYLRKQGITLPIMVMHPIHFETILTYQLEPEIYSLEILKALKHFIQTRSTTTTLPIHLKLETGLHRLGIDAAALPALIALIKSSPQLHVASLFSHLAAAQTAAHDPYTLQQAAQFSQMANYVAQQLAIQPLKHLLNSNGILRFPQFQWDMVRLGIGLYGVGVDAATQPNLIPASTLKTTVIQVKHLPKQATIGYNCKAMAENERTIAIIPIGYADGLKRTFGHGRGRVCIQGHYCPLIGEIYMDMATVDVTGLPIQRGDEVIVWDTHYTVDAFAQQGASIAYEMLTQISPRVKRIYHY